MDWEKIRGHIVAKDVTMYYVAGSLCLDTKEGVLCLDVDGTASYFSNLNSEMIQPKYINELVQRKYVEIKGDTDYFARESLLASLRYNGGSNEN